MTYTIIIEVIIEVEPDIIVQPVDTVGLLYNPVQLTCYATGSPLPIVRWYKEDVPITPPNEHTPILEISELSINSRGFYHCTASSIISGIIVSVASTKVLLSIDGKFYILIGRMLMKCL